MIRTLLDGENRYHMPSLFGQKILFCVASPTDQYFELQGGWVLTQTERRTPYRDYSMMVGDINFELGAIENIKELWRGDNEHDIQCNPHAYLRSDGKVELTFVNISVLGKNKSKPKHEFMKQILDQDFNSLSEVMRVRDCFVSDCYTAVENSRFRACATPVITKPLIYIYDKKNNMQYKLKIGQIAMIRRLSHVDGNPHLLVFSTPTNKTSNNHTVYEHYCFNLDTKEVQKITVENDTPYKLSLNSTLNAVYSVDCSEDCEYKMQIKLSTAQFAPTKIPVRIEGEIRRPYQWL